MLEEDWLQVHKKFSEIVKKVNRYIKTNYAVTTPRWDLILSEKPKFESCELITFNVIAYFNENVGTVLRDISLRISPILFVSYSPSCGISTCPDLPSVLSYFEGFPLNGVLEFASPSKSPKRYIFNKSSTLESYDDLGICNLDFEDLNILSPVLIPSDLKERHFEAVGNYYRAPLSVSDFDCILFAQRENAYDEKAIQIRRWFPVRRAEHDYSSLPHQCYDYGYISRDCNSELHSFMIDNDSRILFAKVLNKKVQIIGGIESFNNELSDFHVPPFVIQFLK